MGFFGFSWDCLWSLTRRDWSVMNNIQSRGHYSSPCSLNMLVWNAAVDCVVVRIVCVMYRYCKATCVSDVNMVNQCALWCCWAWNNLKLDMSSGSSSASSALVESSTAKCTLQEHCVGHNVCHTPQSQDGVQCILLHQGCCQPRSVRKGESVALY